MNEQDVVSGGFKKHDLILEGRTALTVSGVEDVDSFDESGIVLFTVKGLLTVKGEQLHVNKFSIETGELTLEGNIDGLFYADEPAPKGGGFLAKLFR